MAVSRQRRKPVRKGQGNETTNAAADLPSGLSDLEWHNQGGLVCAKCGCRMFSTVSTRRVMDMIQRRRECRNCGWRRTTIECDAPETPRRRRPAKPL